MGKMVIALAFLILSVSCFASSDLTGVQVGQVERLIIGLSNSSGLFEPNANCSILMYKDGAVVVGSTLMGNMGSGNYDYNWTPSVVGYYVVRVNCTTWKVENYTAGGTVFVRSRLFERSVAYGEAQYGDQYLIANDQPTLSQASPAYDLKAAAVVAGLVLLGLVLYEKGVFKLAS